MKTKLTAFFLLFSLLGLAAPPATRELKIAGTGIQSTVYTEQSFSALPHKTITVTEHDQKVTYDAVLLNELLKSAGAPSGKEMKGPAFRLGLVAKASDGYQVLIALNSLEPDFGGLEVYIADKQNGKPLPEGVGPFRLVVLGDKRPARSVRMLSEISLIDVGEAPK
jgi:hypothetical protein